MLPKLQRLSSDEVENVMINGNSIISDFFLVKFLKTDRHVLTKISAISPKKTFPTAVMRNRARRRIYSAISKLPNINLGFLAVIIGNKKILTETLPNITLAIEQGFKKGGIL